MDIVYLVKHDPDNNSEELRYSLRSLRNIPHSNVIIVGEKPDWVTNVTFIPVAQSRTRYENVLANMNAAVNSNKVSDDFLMMNDDFFFMKPIQAMPVLNLGSLKVLISLYDQRYPGGSDYINKLKLLYSELLTQGFAQPLSFELHTPMVFNKHQMAQLLLGTTISLNQFRTVYGNYFNVGGKTIPDVKIFIEPQHNNDQYRANPAQYLVTQTFLSVTGGSFKRGIPGQFIRSRLTEKSDYEF